MMLPPDVIYALTSSQYEGQLVFGYRQGWLVQFICEATLNDAQRDYLMGHLPVQEEQLKTLRGNSRTLRIEVLEEDLGFERFWDAYNYKVARRRAEALWQRLSQADRQHALRGIARYDTWLAKRQVAKCYPETYLRNRRWEDYQN